MFARSKAAADHAVIDEHGGRAAAVTILPGKPLPLGLAPVAAAPADLSDIEEHALEPAFVGGAPESQDDAGWVPESAPTAGRRSFGLRRKGKAEPDATVEDALPTEPPAFDPSAFAPPAPVSPFAPQEVPAPDDATVLDDDAAAGEAHVVTEVHAEPVTDEFADDAEHTAEFADLMDTTAPLPPAYAPLADDVLPPPPYVAEVDDVPAPPPYVAEVEDVPAPPPYVAETHELPPPAAGLPAYVPPPAAPVAHLPEVREPVAAPPAPRVDDAVAAAPSGKATLLQRLGLVPSAAPVAPTDEDPFADQWSPAASALTAAATDFVPPAYEPPAAAPVPPPYVAPAEAAAPPPYVPDAPAPEPVELAVAQPVPPVEDAAAGSPLPPFGQLVPTQVTPQDAFPAAPTPTIGLVFADGSHAEVPDGPAGAALQHVANVLGDHENRRQNGADQAGAAPIE